MNLKELLLSVTVFGTAVSSFALPTIVDQCDLLTGTGQTLNPDYTLVGFSSTTSSVTVSTAPGCTATHARFANTPGTPDVSPAFSVTPTSSPLVVGATYSVAVTFGNNTGTSMESASIVVQPTVTGVSSNNFPATTTAFQQGGGGLNAWAVIGNIVPSTPTPTITFAYDSGTLTGFRFYAYAVQFVELAPPPPPPSNTPEYWDTNGSTAGIGGTGTWDAATTANWNPTNTGTGTAATYLQAGLADFGGTAGTVSIDPVNGITSDGGLEFDTTGYVIQSGTLTLGLGTNITITNATDIATINSVIAGTNGLAQYGPGTLVLGNTNSFIGTVTVTGTLQLTDNHNQAFTSLTGLGNLNLGNNTLTLGDSTALNLSFDGVISDDGPGTPGSLIKVGSATSQLTGTNTFNGTVAVNGGLLNIAGSASLGVGTGNISLNGGTLQNNAGGTVGFLNSETRPIVIGASGGGLGVSVAPAALVYRNGTISGSGILYKSGAGTLTLSDPVTPTSTLVTTPYLAVIGGLWRVASDTALGAVPGSPLANAITLSGAGGISANGSFTINSNRLITLASEATFNVLTNVNLVCNSPITGTANAPTHITGSGVFTLGVSNAFNGDFQIAGPTVAVGDDNALGTATLNLLTAPAGFCSADANTRTLANPVTFGVSTTFGSPTTGNLIFNGAVNTGNIAKVITVSNAVTTFNGVISGTGGNSNTKSGAGTLVFTGANTYPKPTVVAQGTLLVNNTSGSGTGTGNVTVNSGATFGGSGAITGTVDLSGTLAPGATGPGTLTTADETWEGGSSYTWEINQAGGTAGANPGWDQANITGALNINANSGNPCTINITSLTLGNAAGPVSDFTSTHSYSWSIAHTATGINGFDPTAFVLNTSGFSNSVGSGAFSITNNATDILLVFTSATPPAPHISNIHVAGTNLSITGTGGAPNGTYRVLMSTNITTHLATWAQIGSGSYDNSGNFSFSGSPTPGDKREFYVIASP